MQLIDIENIVLDSRFQVRERLSESSITELQQLYKDGADLPVLLIAEIEERLYLLAGFHRLEAQKRNGNLQVLSEVRQMNWDEAIILATCSNKNHGTKLTSTEKIAAIKKVLLTASGKNLSDTDIVKLLGVSRYLIGRARDEMYKEWSQETPKPEKKDEEPEVFSGKKDRFGVPIPLSMISMLRDDSPIKVIQRNLKELTDQYLDNSQDISLALAPAAGISKCFRDLATFLEDSKFYCVCTACFGRKVIGTEQCSACCSFGKPVGWMTKEMYETNKGEIDEGNL